MRPNLILLIALLASTGTQAAARITAASSVNKPRLQKSMIFLYERHSSRLVGWAPGHCAYGEISDVSWGGFVPVETSSYSFSFSSWWVEGLSPNPSDFYCETPIETGGTGHGVEGNG
ncbi:MAG: hypothetical protein AB7G93_03920 [Bdellovibrionales bacterium]